MRNLRAWAVRFRSFFKKSQLEQDIREELESNLQMEIDENVRLGLSPVEARRRALAKFGSLESVTEQCRDRRGIPFIETALKDVAYAFRMLRQNKGWGFVACVSLALGIGVNTALFSVVNSVWLQTLPVRDPGSLVSLRWVGETNMSNGRSGYGYIAPDAQGTNVDGRFRDATFSYRVFQEFRGQTQLAEFFAYANIGSVNFFANDQAELATAQVVSGNFFRELGLSAIRGRLLSRWSEEFSGNLD